MSRKAERVADLQFAFEQFKKSGHGDWLADIIRSGGATNVPWPSGMAEAVANLISQADPWSSRDQTHADDTWIYFVYWRETEFRTGSKPKELNEKPKDLNKAGIRAVKDWFDARGTPKEYETIRTRLRENYEYWRSKLTDEDLTKMIDAAGGGGKT